jgi:hypothetical protein
MVQKEVRKVRRLLVGLLSLVFVAGPGSVWAQFNPDEQGIVRGGGGETNLTIKQLGPGTVELLVTNIYAVFLDGKGMPSGVKAHMVEADHSGKGVSSVVNVAAYPELSRLFFCWRGVGSQWKTQKCSSLIVSGNSGSASVVVDVGVSKDGRDQLFGLVPVLVPSPDVRTEIWASHPIETRVLMECPGDRGGVRDMISLFVRKGDRYGTVLVAKEGLRQYQQFYTQAVCPFR